MSIHKISWNKMSEGKGRRSRLNYVRLINKLSFDDRRTFSLSRHYWETEKWEKWNAFSAVSVEWCPLNMNSQVMLWHWAISCYLSPILFIFFLFKNADVPITSYHLNVSHLNIRSNKFGSKLFWIFTQHIL